MDIYVCVCMIKGEADKLWAEGKRDGACGENCACRLAERSSAKQRPRTGRMRAQVEELR